MPHKGRCDGMYQPCWNGSSTVFSQTRFYIKVHILGVLFCVFPGWKHTVKHPPNYSFTWQNRITVPYCSPTSVSTFFDTLSFVMAHHWIPKQQMLLIHYGHVKFLLIFNCFGFLNLVLNEIQIDAWLFFFLLIQNKYPNMIKSLKVL